MSTTSVVDLAIVDYAIVDTVDSISPAPEPTVSTGPLTVWAIDPSGIRRGQLHPLEATMLPRDADVGSWQMTLDLGDDLARRLTAGWRVLLGDNTTSMSGRIISFEYTRNGGAVDLIITGVDELARLDHRIIYPNPAKPADQQDRARYELTGPSETVIRELVWRNLGTAALLARRSPALVTVASQDRGARVKISERLSNLLEAARSYARLGGTTFSAVDENGTVLFRQRIPADRSHQVRFTDLNGGIRSGSLKLTAPTVTAAIVAGQGEGADRDITEALAEVDLWGTRIEKLVDRRDTDDSTVTDQAGTEALAEGAATASASVEVEEVPGAVFGLDFQLGDTITAEIAQGVSIAQPVRAAEVTWDGFGRAVKLTLGDDPDPEDPEWAAQVRELASRISRQEAI